MSKGILYWDYQPLILNPWDIQEVLRAKYLEDGLPGLVGS